MDLTEHLTPGRHVLRIRVASALVNRLIARGYYDRLPDLVGSINGTNATVAASVQDAGLLGPVRLVALEPRGREQPARRSSHSTRSDHPEETP